MEEMVVNKVAPKKLAKPKKLTKKVARKEVFAKLAGALEEYRNRLDKKKFENKLKKASKLFAVDIAKSFKKDWKTNGKKKADKQK